MVTPLFTNPSDKVAEETRSSGRHVALPGKLTTSSSEIMVLGTT